MLMQRCEPKDLKFDISDFTTAKDKLINSIEHFFNAIECIHIRV